jgi:hypothetical protein
MFVVQISLLIVTFLSLISSILSLMQTTKEVNSHPRIAPCVNMWSVFFFFFFFCHLLNVGTCIRHVAPSGVDHTSIGDRRTFSNCPHNSFVWFHNVTCYTNSTVSRIHVNTTKLRNIMCILVATGVILRSWESIYGPYDFVGRHVEGKKRESVTELECISCCKRLTAGHMHLKSSDGLYLPRPHLHWWHQLD